MPPGVAASAATSSSTKPAAPASGTAVKATAGWPSVSRPDGSPREEAPDAVARVDRAGHRRVAGRERDRLRGVLARAEVGPGDAEEALARYTTTGRLLGVTTTDFGTGEDAAEAVALTPGHATVAGSIYTSHGVARYLTR